MNLGVGRGITIATAAIQLAAASMPKVSAADANAAAASATNATATATAVATNAVPEVSAVFKQGDKYKAVINNQVVDADGFVDMNGQKALIINNQVCVLKPEVAAALTNQTSAPIKETLKEAQKIEPYKLGEVVNTQTGKGMVVALDKAEVKRSGFNKFLVKSGRIIANNTISVVAGRGVAGQVSRTAVDSGADEWSGRGDGKTYKFTVISSAPAEQEYKIGDKIHGYPNSRVTVAEIKGEKLIMPNGDKVDMPKGL